MAAVDAYLGELVPDAAPPLAAEVLAEWPRTGSDAELLRHTRRIALARVSAPAADRASGWRGRLSAEHRDRCAEVPAQLAARAADDLSPEDRRKLEGHLAGCSDCRELDRRMLAAEVAFAAVLSSGTSELGAGNSSWLTAEPAVPAAAAEPLPEAIPAPEPTPEVIAAPEPVLEESADEAPVAEPRRGRQRLVLVLGAVLVVLFLAGGAVALAVALSSGSTKPKPKPTAATVPTPVAAAPVVPTPAVPVSRPVHHRHRVHRAVHHASTQSTSPTVAAAPVPAVTPAPAAAPVSPSPTATPPASGGASPSGAGGSSSGGGAGSVSIQGGGLPASGAPTKTISSGSGSGP